MEILFTKTSDGEHVLSCRREDGSVTWHHVSEFFLLHDVCHFSVETVLKFGSGFFGMLASGTDITTFDLPKEQRTVQLTPEAIFTEHLVNLLVIEYKQGRMDNLIEIFYSIHDEYIIDSELLQQLSEDKLEEIRIKYAEVMNQWKILPVNQTLSLVFEI